MQRSSTTESTPELYRLCTLALVGRGLSNHEIAERLFVSPLTARTHIQRAMTKLNARDRAQLVVIAYESGLVQPGGGH